VYVLITAVLITQLFAWGEGDRGGHVLRDVSLLKFMKRAFLGFGSCRLCQSSSCSDHAGFDQFVVQPNLQFCHAIELNLFLLGVYFAQRSAARA